MNEPLPLKKSLYYSVIIEKKKNVCKNTAEEFQDGSLDNTVTAERTDLFLLIQQFASCDLNSLWTNIMFQSENLNRSI